MNAERVSELRRQVILARPRAKIEISREDLHELLDDRERFLGMYADEVELTEEADRERVGAMRLLESWVGIIKSSGNLRLAIAEGHRVEGKNALEAHEREQAGRAAEAIAAYEAFIAEVGHTQAQVEGGRE